jgi:hypothetical protein
MAALRALVTVGLGLLIMALIVPLIFKTPPRVYTGITRASQRAFEPNKIDVAVGSPAYRAGLRSGDIVSCLSLRDRELLFPRFGFNAYAPGMVVHLCVKRAQLWRSVAFTPATAPSYTLLYYTVPLTLVRLAVFAVFLVTGIALVLARPTLLTALFYVYCIASGPFYVITVYGTTWPAWFYGVWQPFNIAFTSLGVVCLALFALCVPGDGIPKGWRRTAFIAIAVLAIVPLWNAVASVAWTSIWVPGGTFQAIDEAFTAIAVLIVVVRLFEVRGEERARLSWVVFALAWGVIMNDLRNNVGVHGTAWEVFSSVAADLTVVMPIMMLYAILKRHLIDVRFVISRTVVYAFLTTLIVGIIGLVDWLTSAYLSQVRVAMAIDAAVTIGLAFVLHRAYGWVESAVDFMLFRRKHEAERYLDRVARTLMFAEHEEAVDKALVHDPFDKLGLTAAALYRAQTGAYVATRVEGWSRANAPAFCADDDLVRFMVAERTKIALGDLRAHVAEPFRLQGHTPAVAIPVFQGNRLTGFAVYGLHRDGTKLDPDEVQTLEHLCAAAAQAYTGIELARYQSTPPSVAELDMAARLA